MIVAVDTNCILPGRVGGIENYTLGLIEALKLPESPATKLILLTRTENHALFSGFSDGKTEVVLLERPQVNWEEMRRRDPAGAQKALRGFQEQKQSLLHDRGVEVVHFPGNTINPIDLDLPVVLNLHDLQHRHFPQYFSDAEIASREKWWVASGRRADALIAASHFVKDDLVKELGLEAQRIFVTPDVFQTAFLRKPMAAQLAEVRQRHKLADVFFLYPAAAWPHKNHERLLRAFESTAIAGAQLVLTGAGHGETTAPDGVRILGRVSTEDLVAIYYLATALMFASEYESWSIPIMEAMACGCPVASSNVTSLPEQVKNAGLLFDPHDIAAMAGIMELLASDEPLRKSLSQKGIERVREFSPRNFVQAIGRAYEFACSAYRSRKAA